MTQLVEPDVAAATFSGYQPTIKFSPDGRHFAVVTRRGDLTNERNEYRLILYRTSSVLDFINADTNESGPETFETSYPEGKVLALFHSTSNDAAIRELRWLPDNRTLAFIGTNKKEPAQIFTIDIQSQEIHRLTDHPRPIVFFDIDLASGTIIYTSSLERYREAHDQAHYIVEKQNIVDVIYMDKAYKWRMLYQYYTLQMNRDGPALALGKPFSHLGKMEMWLSPTGHWAVARRSVQDFPQDWAERYLPIANNGYMKSMLAGYDDNTMSPSTPPFWQFVLVDIKNGAAEPIFEAPMGFGYAGTRVAAQWLPDGQSVILGNTFLPLNTPDDEEQTRRRQSPATVEFDVQTKEVARVMDHVILENEFRAAELFDDMTLGADGTLSIVRSWSDNQRNTPLPPKYYRKHNGQWAEVAGQHRGASANSLRLELSIQQNLNLPPEILAHDTRTGRENIITNMNPQFDALTFGKVEKFEWTDVTGGEWLGALIFPPGFEAGTRHPLVIQTGGFRENHFILEGNSSLAGAFAAQAFANRGMLVLQMPDHAVGASDYRHVNLIGAEAAIDALNDEGYIDKSRVGAIGFSRTAHVVQHWITFSDYEFAAATVSDGYTLSFSSYTISYGLEAPGMGLTERSLGAVPWGRGLDKWTVNNPVLQLDRVRTPLLLQSHRGKAGLLPSWDIYTILRRQAKPVDWLVIQEGEHNLVKPTERFIAQQMNVDWFDFWLNGRERTEPFPGTPETEEGLARQYERWRKLRRQQEQSEIEAMKARQRYKEEAARSEQYQLWLQQQEAANDDTSTVDEALVQE